MTSIMPQIMQSEWREPCSVLSLTADFISMSGYGSYSFFILYSLSSSLIYWSPWRIKDGFSPHSRLAVMSSTGFSRLFRPVVHRASDSIPNRVYARTRFTLSPQPCILDYPANIQNSSHSSAFIRLFPFVSPASFHCKPIEYATKLHLSAAS